MADHLIRLEGQESVPAQALQPQSFEKLRELMRHGYVADPDAKAEADGILLRHEAAPALILKVDGTIELPVGQAAPQVRPTTKEVAPLPRKRISWSRTLLVIVLAAILWFVSLAITVNLTAS